jgi:hypothetical protein
VLRADTSGLAVLVVWERVTPSDHAVRFPGTHVLARIPDARAQQFWDEDRMVSKAMVRQLPADTLRSVASTSGDSPIAWDTAALFPPGTPWTSRFPVPAWSGRPVVEVLDALRRNLQQVERSAATQH